MGYKVYSNAAFFLDYIQIKWLVIHLDLNRNGREENTIELSCFKEINMQISTILQVDHTLTMQLHGF